MEKFLETVQLVEWYEKIKCFPTESEVTNHIVTPLLLALGWNPRSISYERAIACGKIRKGRIDVVLHDGHKRQDDRDVVGFIEVKKHGKMETGPNMAQQLQGYCDLDTYPRLSIAVMTDGFKFKPYIFGKNQPVPRPEIDIRTATWDDFKDLSFDKVMDVVSMGINRHVLTS